MLDGYHQNLKVLLESHENRRRFSTSHINRGFQPTLPFSDCLFSSGGIAKNWIKSNSNDILERKIDSLSDNVPFKEKTVFGKFKANT